LPLNVSQLNEQKRRQERPFVAEIEIPSGIVTPITDRDLSVIGGDEKNRELLLSSESSQKGRTSLTAYKREGSEWREQLDSQSYPVTRRPDVKLEENINTPPKLVLQRHESDKPDVTIDLNPQFASLQFSPGETVQWRSSEGHNIEGGLYLPIHYLPGRTYPLVIQTHGFDPNHFYIDGPFTTAFAAQALAGLGFVVLQTGIDLNRDRNAGPWSDQKGAHAMAMYEGAIDYLARRGLINRNRVGLVGFSATCYGVLYTLTHSKYPFAAAIISDGIDGGYFQYMLTANGYSPTADYFELVNGGPPFGAGLQSWLQNAPGFNMDKIRAPLRIEAIGNFSLIASWESLAGLKRLRKPVELIWIRDGVHILQRPSDRLISQQGTVDWLSFWLMPDEHRSVSLEHYNRWSELRELQKRDMETKSITSPR
jgi:dipeptidyl aminopeptidase/acylaminoacyl peptidase